MRVYLYDDELAPFPPRPFGPSLDDRGTTAASGPTYVNAMHAKLQSIATPDPENASLFFIPESAAKNGSLCAALESRLDAYWARRGAVNYFRRRRGMDHFSPFHTREALLACATWQTLSFARVVKLVGVLQSPWYREGEPLPISSFQCRTAVCPWLPNETRAGTELAAAQQRVIEVPYGGSVHGSASWRQQHRRGRNLLAVAAFNSRGHLNHHRQMELRRVLIEQCEGTAAEARVADGLPQRRCRVVDLRGRYNLAGTDDREGHYMLQRTLFAYRRSVFALQPAGDDPSRKGIIDAVTCGAIPVLFQPQQRQLWPHHWGGWVEHATVLLPIALVLDGSLNVLTALRAIPLARVAFMQQTIARHAHQLHYALVGSPDAAGDALEISLDQVARLANVSQKISAGHPTEDHLPMPATSS